MSSNYDQMVADLERIAREVPTLPTTFSELRALLNLIGPITGVVPYEYRGPDWNPQAAGQALNQQTLIGLPPQSATQQTISPSVAQYIQTSDTQLLRTGTEEMTYSDLSYGAAILRILGDIIFGLNSNWTMTYNGDQTLHSATRAGVAGAATVTVNYSSPGVISSVVVVKGGKTVTITPTYSGAQIGYFTRAVA